MFVLHAGGGGVCCQVVTYEMLFFQICCVTFKADLLFYWFVKHLIFTIWRSFGRFFDKFCLNSAEEHLWQACVKVVATVIFCQSCGRCQFVSNLWQMSVCVKFVPAVS